MFATNAVYVLFIYSIFLLPIIALEVIVGWRTLQKMGEKGWKIFIPFYNEYLVFKRVWDKNVFWFQLVFTALYLTVCVMIRDPQNESYTVLLSILVIITGCVGFVIHIFRQLHLSKAFGRSNGFAVGLIFVPIVMTCIIAFGRAQYIGIQPIRKEKTRTTE